MDMIKIKQSTQYISNKISSVPYVGIILGSGLGSLISEVENKKMIRYSEIPNMPIPTVKGHAGEFIFGRFRGKDVVMMNGRIHYYEGNSMQDVVLPIYIMKLLGIEKLIVTNAAGGVNTSFKSGDLMIIKDHINFSFSNPLIGKNDENIGPRFPDMSHAYNKELIEIAQDCGRNLNIDLKVGNYFMMSGPSYETPAEINMVRMLGGDAVGMSTVPEVIAANHCGLKILGISCITNMASGILDKPLNHAEVIETSNRVKDKFNRLVSEIVKNIK